MGYMTDYELSYKGEISPDEDLVEKLNKITGYEWDDCLELSDVMWYDSLNDMKKVSKEFPNVVFTLNGSGEESGDIWAAYFKNGRIQYEKAEFIITEYDEDKLSDK